MGYRSEVAICIRAEDEEKFLSTLEPNDKDWDTRKESESSIVFHWEWVKWYESYPVTQKIESAMRSLADYHFIRIGEDYEDVVEEFEGCGLDFGLGISRCISGI